VKDTRAKKCELTAQYSGRISVTEWNNKRYVRGKGRRKPVCVLNYRLYRECWCEDQLLHHMCQNGNKEQVKWYVKLFWRMLSRAVKNSVLRIIRKII